MTDIYDNNKIVLNIKELRYRRLKKAPFLTDANKLERYLWCLRNKNNKFKRCLFADETSIWQRELPFYHVRPIGSIPEGIPFSSKSVAKFNICGAISTKGITNFAVILKLNNCKKL